MNDPAFDMNSPIRGGDARFRAHLAENSSLAPDAVLAKALGRAATIWKFSNKELGRVIGMSEASISRLLRGKGKLSEGSSEWQLSLLFLRLFRGLHGFMGGHVENERAWLHAPNHALGGVPREMIGNVEGLVRVVQYVDQARGQ